MIPLKNVSHQLVAKYAQGIDHIAIAVKDLDDAIGFYHNIMGFECVERRETKGERSAMVSAVMRASEVTLVLVQGTNPKSQVCRFIDHYGPGVQHFAIRVSNMETLVDQLKQKGFQFDTTIIRSSGLRQIFSKRDPNSGCMIELIERLDNDSDFSDESVSELFRQMEANDSF